MMKCSRLVFEKKLIEERIRVDGKCPITGGLLTMNDIIPILTGKVQNSSSVAPALKGPSSSNNETSSCVAAEESACPPFPDSITKDIKFNQRCLLQTRKRCRTISPSLATVDALRGYIFNKGYTIHKTEMPGVLSLDIDNSKDIIATGGADANAVVFDLLSRKIVSTLNGHSEKVTSVKFVNKGELVVTGSGDNTVRVWKRSEKGSYKCKDIVDHHTAEVRAVTVHPSQKYFVTASLDCTWQFYDLSSESRVTRFACRKGSESFSTAVFHPDGQILGTCASGLVQFWDVAKQDDILKIDAHTRPVTSIAFSENGYSLATAAGDGVKLWDLRFLRNMKTFPSDDISQTRSVDFDHSGKYLATGGASISIYEIGASSDPVAIFSHMSSTGDFSCVKFGKEAKYVAAARTLGSKLLLFGTSKGKDS
ncbi:pre-mRNA-processing factor 19-like isoform X2 [Apium graveolens]|uniref:pre-mRNA-processing factor 19-like isoform X2 n=1 Tax=Apium graveolens TaxID=4045 RepID=UPI003D7A6D4D